MLSSSYPFLSRILFLSLTPLALRQGTIQRSIQKDGFDFLPGHLLSLSQRQVLSLLKRLTQPPCHTLPKPGQRRALHLIGRQRQQFDVGWLVERIWGKGQGEQLHILLNQRTADLGEVIRLCTRYQQAACDCPGIQNGSRNRALFPEGGIARSYPARFPQKRIDFQMA